MTASRPRDRLESWTILRRRMLRETEAFLEDGLRRPDRQFLIPAVPVGKATFPREFAHVFWAQVLGSS